MTDTEDSTKTEIAVINTKLDIINENLKTLTHRLHENNTTTLSRNEWEMRNHYVDGKFQSLGREIGELRTEFRTDKRTTETRKPHWTSIVAVIVAMIVLSLDIISRYVI